MYRLNVLCVYRSVHSYDEFSSDLCAAEVAQTVVTAA